MNTIEAYNCIARRYNHARKRRKNHDGIKITSPSGIMLTVLVKRVRPEDWEKYQAIEKVIADQDKRGVFPKVNSHTKVWLTYEELNSFKQLYDNQACHTRANEPQKRITFLTFKPLKLNTHERN